MNKTLLALVAIFIGSISLSLAQKAQPEVKQDGFNGPVNTVTTITYEAFDNGGKTLERGDILEHIQTTYQPNGMRKSMHYYSQEEDILFRSRYKHDGFGLTTLEHIVDNNDNIVGRTYYIYSPSFYLTEYYTEDQQRQIETRTILKYDSHGRVGQRIHTDAKGNTYRREVYNYSLENILLKTVIFDRNGNKMRELRYEYDQNQQPITQTIYDYSEPEPEIYITLYRYKYDNQRNWIQRTEYTIENNTPTAQTIVERTIQYY